MNMPILARQPQLSSRIPASICAPIGPCRGADAKAPPG
jgi:hypothetical protein